MIKFLRARRAALRGDAGAISVSIPELMTSMVVRIVVYTGLISAVAVLLLMWVSTTTSAQTSASMQASSARFDEAVARADFVKGSSADTVALMRTVGTTCEVVVWRNVTIDGKATLVSEKSTVSAACTTATAIPAPSKTDRNALLPNVSKAAFSYSNVGGRDITYSSAGNVTLKSAPLPPGIAAQDWNDVRPKHVTLEVETAAEGLTTYARNAKMGGTTNIVNFAEAKDGSNYVLPEPMTVFPDPLATISVTRSSTTGSVFSGVREGATVSFSGGACVALPSIITVTWTPSSPAGQAVETATFSRVLNGSTVSFEMPRIRNGAEGAMSVGVKCEAIAEPNTMDTPYTQTVPQASLSVTNGVRAEEHDLNWTAVSSLPTTFSVTYDAQPAKTNGSGNAGSTTALSKVVAHPAGTTYGYATIYTVTPAVGAVGATPQTGWVSDSWPAPPSAVNITYTHTAAGGVFANGDISWDYSAACPAGTVAQSREVLTKVFDSNTGVAYEGNFQIGSFASKQRIAWAYPAVLQGSPYEERIDVKCVSPVTGSQSGLSYSPSPIFYTPMAQPAAPVYIGFDYIDWVRGDTTGYMTCYGIRPNACNTTYTAPIQNGASYTMDYQTYCAPGSSIRNPQAQTAYTTVDWNNRTYAGFFGRPDGWQLPDNKNTYNIQHNDPVYNCSTLWQTSPNSLVGADIVYTVNRIW